MPLLGWKVGLYISPDSRADPVLYLRASRRSSAQISVGSARALGNPVTNSWSALFEKLLPFVKM